MQGGAGVAVLLFGELKREFQLLGGGGRQTPRRKDSNLGFEGYQECFHFCFALQEFFPLGREVIKGFVDPPDEVHGVITAFRDGLCCFQLAQGRGWVWVGLGAHGGDQPKVARKLSTSSEGVLLVTVRLGAYQVYLPFCISMDLNSQQRVL